MLEIWTVLDVSWQLYRVSLFFSSRRKSAVSARNEIKHHLLSAADKHKYNVAVNSAVRRISKFRYRQSIRQLREFYCYDSIEIMLWR